MQNRTICSFKTGDYVVYRPSQRGYDFTVMSSQRLVPGKAYTVKAIEKTNYILVEGDDDPCNGLHWTEFVGC